MARYVLSRGGDHGRFAANRPSIGIVQRRARKCEGVRARKKQISFCESGSLPHLLFEKDFRASPKKLLHLRVRSRRSEGGE